GRLGGRPVQPDPEPGASGEQQHREERPTEQRPPGVPWPGGGTEGPPQAPVPWLAGGRARPRAAAVERLKAGQGGGRPRRVTVGRPRGTRPSRLPADGPLAGGVVACGPVVAGGAG